MKLKDKRNAVLAYFVSKLKDRYVSDLFSEVSMQILHLKGNEQFDSLLQLLDSTNPNNKLEEFTNLSAVIYHVYNMLYPSGECSKQEALLFYQAAMQLTHDVYKKQATICLDKVDKYTSWIPTISFLLPLKEFVFTFLMDLILPKDIVRKEVNDKDKSSSFGFSPCLYVNPRLYKKGNEDLITKNDIFNRVGELRKPRISQGIKVYTLSTQQQAERAQYKSVFHKESSKQKSKANVHSFSEELSKEHTLPVKCR